MVGAVMTTKTSVDGVAEASKSSETTVGVASGSRMSEKVPMEGPVGSTSTEVSTPAETETSTSADKDAPKDAPPGVIMMWSGVGDAVEARLVTSKGSWVEDTGKLEKTGSADVAASSEELVSVLDPCTGVAVTFVVAAVFDVGKTTGGALSELPVAMGVGVDVMTAVLVCECFP
jgi:hypothetical protein